MKFARGTPFRFLALNAAGASALVGVMIFTAASVRTGEASPLVILAEVLALLGWLWVLLLLLFFRDPERAPGDGVVSPADGRVKSGNSSGLGASVSIFLGVFNVHVVRAPIGGRVTALAYKPGGKRFAFSKDSHLNERLVLGLAGEGESCSLTLIAGAFADRILAYVEPGAQVKKGDRIGIIKFGSRVDLEYASQAPASLVVKVGDMVIAGRTSILLPPKEDRPR